MDSMQSRRAFGAFIFVSFFISSLSACGMLMRSEVSPSDGGGTSVVAIPTPTPTSTSDYVAGTGGNTTVNSNQTTGQGAGNTNTVVGDANNIISNANLATGAVATFIGRTISLDANNPSHVRFAWPGVAVGANFLGTSIAASLRDYTNAYAGGPSGNSYYDVTIDGQPGTPFGISFNTNTYMLAQNLPYGQHTVWLRKRTEAMIGSTEFFGFSVSDGGNFLTPPAYATRRIEMIGASIETGYGAEGLNCTGYQANLQNQDVAWPQLTANALSADLYNISYSGKGMINNIDPVDDPTNTVPVLYELSDPMNFGVNWTFNDGVADVVIFDVGGNDWEGLGSAPDPNTFDTTFEHFITHVLTHYPNAHVYVTQNSTDPPDQRAGLIVDFRKIVADMALPRVHYFEFAEYSGSTYGCDGHPDLALHQAMANAIVPQIRADLGW